MYFPDRLTKFSTSYDKASAKNHRSFENRPCKITVSCGHRVNCPGHDLAWPPWPEAIMACDGLRVVLVASEWPQARPASGHARPGHGLRPARRPGAGASGGSGDNYYLKSRNILVSWQTMPEVLKRQYLEVFLESYRF